jgi:hypothetical protein
LCRSKGMRLVSIDSDREQRALVTSSTSLDYKGDQHFKYHHGYFY